MSIDVPVHLIRGYAAITVMLKVHSHKNRFFHVETSDFRTGDSKARGHDVWDMPATKAFDTKLWGHVDPGERFC